MIAADRDYVKSKYKLEKIKDIEDPAAEAVQVNIPFNNYITGFCALIHKASIHAKATLANPSTYEIIHPADFGVERYIHFASRITGWNAVKSRAQRLKIEMTDKQYKECTAKIKALADIRALAVDDVDSILHAFHRNVKSGKDHPIEIPNMTDKERRLMAEKEAEIAAIAAMTTKRRLEELAEDEDSTERVAKKAKTNGITA